MPRIFYIISFLLAFNAHANVNQALSIECDDKPIEFEKIFHQFNQIEKANDAKLEKAEHESSTPFVDSRASQYTELYNECLAPISLQTAMQTLTNKELQQLFRALNRVNFFTADQLSATDLEKVFKEKVKRKLQVENQVKDLYRSYIRSRLFDEGKALAAQYNHLDLSQIPEISNSTLSGKRLMALNKDNNALISNQFTMPKRNHIIIVSSPICNPCRRLFKWLETQPELMQLVVDNSTWIIPVTDDFYLDELIEVNQAYAPIKLQYVYDTKDWPEITDWSTPIFYFFKDGKVAKQLAGWPKEGRKAGLIRGLKAISLL